MAYSKSKSSGGGTNWRPVVSQEKASAPFASLQTVRGLIQESRVQHSTEEFYELELAEVIDVLLDEDELPELEDGSGKNWEALGAVLARETNNELHSPIDNISLAFPLNPHENNYPLRGENVVIVDYMDKRFYTTLVNFFNSPNNNLQPGLSGARSAESIEEDAIFEYFEPDKEIRKMYPYQGDNIYQGRWGQSIRFGSNIIPDSHEDGDSTQHSPNIIIRAGQLLDANAFDKGGIVEDLKNDTTLKKTVKEDINADGSSLWMTTDQSVKLDIEGSNAVSHVFMTSKQSDDQPKNGGKQIVINSDRITFNTKQGKILGFSHDGIGFSTQKSFTIDADETVDMNVGGGSGGTGSSISITDSSLLMTSPTNAGLSIGTDRSILSSPCPSILTLADYANITSCKGAILHLDDCAGLKDNQGSFLRIGGEALGITGYVKGRDDMGQQHLVYGEELTNILDSVCNSFIELGQTILNLAGIPTGAGPSGPISGGPTNTPAIEAWKAGVETIRARLCDLLMKPE